MKSIKRKGFTLVELLIVIVVIGILAAMMMLSSTEAVSSAKANNIISNMRNLKTAVMSWYTDNIDRVKLDGPEYKVLDANDGTTKRLISDFVKNGGAAEILKYLNGDNSMTLKTKNDNDVEGDYLLVAGNHGRAWYVCYNLNNNTAVKGKIAPKARGLGLTGSAAIGSNDDFNGTDYTNQKYVHMLALSIE